MSAIERWMGMYCLLIGANACAASGDGQRGPEDHGPPALIRELQASAKRIQIYASGHPDMVQAIHALGVEHGLPVASECGHAARFHACWHHYGDLEPCR